jgi:hypothetical protein
VVHAQSNHDNPLGGNSAHQSVGRKLGIPRSCRSRPLAASTGRPRMGGPKSDSFVIPNERHLAASEGLSVTWLTVNRIRDRSMLWRISAAR